MKKRIAILVVFLLILCLTLVGCGQGGTDDKTYNIGSTDSAEQSEQGGQSEQDGSDDAEDLPGYNFDTGDATIMDGTNNGTTDGADDSSSDTSTLGTKNADGTYTYNIDGYDFTIKTNVNDYIQFSDSASTYADEQLPENPTAIFFSDQLAEDLGWHIKNPDEADNPNYLAYSWDDEGVYYVLFDNRINGGSHSITYVIDERTDGWVNFERLDLYDKNTTTYRANPNGSFSVNFEQIVLMTYILENSYEKPGVSPLAHIYANMDRTWVIPK